MKHWEIFEEIKLYGLEQVIRGISESVGGRKADAEREAIEYIANCLYDCVKDKEKETSKSKTIRTGSGARFC